MINIINIKDPVNDTVRIKEKSHGNISFEILQTVEEIIRKIKYDGDSALKYYTEKFDGIKLESFKVSEEEIKRAYQIVSEEQIRSIDKIKSRLAKSEETLLEKFNNISVNFKEVSIKKILKPVPSVGCYIPGGQANYASTAIMCIVPARIAGVKRIIAASPPKKDGTVDPLTLVTADISGCHEFYKIGGAQAIAALAFGTESIKKVNKIVGPGGLMVTVAKSLISKEVSIDMPAGPTELLIYADIKANARYIAKDLISQSEHSSDTCCGLITVSRQLAKEVKLEIEKILDKDINRKQIVTKSLQNNGFIGICDNESKAVEFINEFAPEHLQIVCKDPYLFLNKIESSGLILIGDYTPSAASDYCLGTNHVLPTMGFSKTRSSLSVMDFVKLINVVETTKGGLKEIDKFVKTFTECEGLINHYEAIKERLIK